MQFVLDASVALSFLFREPEFESYREFALPRLQAGAALVPPIWRPEVANSVVQAVRRGKLPIEIGEQVALEADQLEVQVDADQPSTRVLFGFARRYQLTAYDATYLELAQRRSLALATLDRDLRAAARAAGIALVK